MQKNLPKYAPDWIRTTTVWANASKREVHYPVCDDRRTLVWLANQRAVEYHPALMRVDSDRQTHLILDLDPPDDVDPLDGFRMAVAAALLVRQALDGRRALGWREDQRRQGRARVRAAHRATPRSRTSRRPPAPSRRGPRGSTRTVATTEFVREERGGKVFVDSTRAGGATVVAAYSPRARPGVPVSFPVTWAELEQVRPGDFTILTAAERLSDDRRPAGPPRCASPQALPADLVAEGHEIPIARVVAMHEGKRRKREEERHQAEAAGENASSPGRPRVVEPHRGARLPVHARGRNDSTVTDAGLSSIRNTDSSGALERLRDQGLDRRHVADHDHGLAGVRLEDPVEPGQHPLLDLAERLAARRRRSRASRARRRGWPGRARRPRRRSARPSVPNSISAKPGSTSTVLPEPLGEDLGRLQRAAYRRGDDRVDALGDRRQPLGGGPDLGAPLVAEPGVGAPEAAGELLGRGVRR